jgi:ABC-type amino acid transport system permease subunit
MTVVWAHILNRNAPDLDTIQTWTCRYKNSHPLPQDMSMPSNLSNLSFKGLCQESKFALYGTLVVFLLLGISMAFTIVTWMADKWAARQQRKEGVEMGTVQS